MFETVNALGGITEVLGSVFQEALPKMALLGAVPAALFFVVMLLGPSPAPEPPRSGKGRRQHASGLKPFRPDQHS